MEVRIAGSINRMITKEEFDILRKKVSSKYGYCKLTDLSGEFEEGIFLVTFADDCRYLIDDNDGKISLLLTSDQREVWEGMTDEERTDMLEEILVFYTLHITQE